MCKPPPHVWGSAADPPLCPCEQQKEAEAASLAQRVTMMASRVQELSTPSALDARAVPALKKQLWDLEASAAEQKKELERQTAAVDHLEEVVWPPWACQAQTSTILVPPRVGATTGVSLGLSAPPAAGAGDRADEADPPEGAGGQGRGVGGRAAVLPEEGRSAARSGGVMLGAPRKPHCPQCTGGAVPVVLPLWGAAGWESTAFPSPPQRKPQSQPWAAESVSPCRAGGAVGDSAREPRACCSG